MNNNKLITRAELPNLSGILGNSGNSWNNPLPNDLYIKGVPKVVVHRFDKVGNAGAGLDPLHTYTIPAGTLKDNDCIFGLASGSYANNNNDKRVVFAIFTVVQAEDFLAATQDIDGGGTAAGWVHSWGLGRIDSTHIALFSNLAGQFYLLDGAGGVVINSSFHHLTRNYASIAVSDLDSNDLIIEFEAEATSNDDVTQTLSIVQLIRF